MRAAVRQRYERLCSGNWIREESPGRARGQDVEAIERELGTTLPDPIVAYIAAGVSIWGDGPISVLGIRERTLEVRERIEELTAGDDDENEGARCVVIDDDSNGNYIGVMPGEKRLKRAFVSFD